MIGRIIRHEWLLVLRDRVLLLVLPLYALLLAYGIADGAGWKYEVNSGVRAAQVQADAKFQARYDGLGAALRGKSFDYWSDPRLAPTMARSEGETATKPMLTAGTIAIGQSDLQPSYRLVQWKPMYQQANVEEIANPENLAAGTFDLAFVLVYIFPLVIIGLGYRVLAGDREIGTQTLLLSQPVSIRQYALGKVLLHSALVIGPAVAVSVIGLLVADPGILAAGQTWRVLLTGAFLIVYGAFWFGLAVLVNSFNLKSETNAFVLVTTWIVLVIIVPAALNVLAKAIYPLPSRIEMVQTMRRADSEAQRRQAADGAFNAELLRMGADMAYRTTANDFYARILPVELDAERRAAAIFERFERQRSAQHSFVDRLKFLSPAATLQEALSDLADNGTESFRDFERQVARFHQQWRGYFAPIILANRLMTANEVKHMPRFRYQAPSNREVMRRIADNAAALLLFALIALAAGFARLRRYSPVSG